VPAPTLRRFAEDSFLPFVKSTFAAKRNTERYYQFGVQYLLSDARIADLPMDSITSEKIAGFVAKQQAQGLEVASINRQLQVLRRMFALALEWGKVERALPKVRMIPGEKHRDRVLTSDEEKRYFEHAEPLLRDAAAILLDCALRPDECFRLRWEQVQDGLIEIRNGKTESARRRIPITARVEAALAMRKDNGSEWVFPAPTRSGHMECSSLKKQHIKACKGGLRDEPGKPPVWSVAPFPLYTLRHTCLTRWAPHMDPWTLAYLAGHRDMAITKRYVHPQADSIRDAMKRAQQAWPKHKVGHNADEARTEPEGKSTLLH
jgi:integrase